MSCQNTTQQIGGEIYVKIFLSEEGVVRETVHNSSSTEQPYSVL
jgi:hypothetical protein